MLSWNSEDGNGGVSYTVKKTVNLLYYVYNTNIYNIWGIVKKILYYIVKITLTHCNKLARSDVAIHLTLPYTLY